MGYLVAPSEPPALKAIGTVSLTTERNGADVLWAESAIGGLVGIQRKEMTDFVESTRDGRLAKEVSQLGNCQLAVLIIEGRPRWSPDGTLIHKYARWSRNAHRNLLLSIQGRGIRTVESDDLTDTIRVIHDVASYAAKGQHNALDKRPSPTRDHWGQITDKGWGCHLLQSVPGIGPVQAEAIWEHFQGRLPIALTLTTQDELSTIPGLGPKRVAAIWKAFGGGGRGTGTGMGTGVGAGVVRIGKGDE